MSGNVARSGHQRVVRRAGASELRAGEAASTAVTRLGTGSSPSPMTRSPHFRRSGRPGPARGHARSRQRAAPCRRPIRGRLRRAVEGVVFLAAVHPRPTIRWAATRGGLSFQIVSANRTQQHDRAATACSVCLRTVRLSAVLVGRLLALAATSARRQPVAVVVEHDRPVAVGAAIATLAGLLADVMCCHAASMAKGCDSCRAATVLLGPRADRAARVGSARSESFHALSATDVAGRAASAQRTACLPSGSQAGVPDQ